MLQESEWYNFLRSRNLNKILSRCSRNMNDKIFSLHRRNLDNFHFLSHSQDDPVVEICLLCQHVQFQHGGKSQQRSWGPWCWSKGFLWSAAVLVQRSASAKLGRYSDRSLHHLRQAWPDDLKEICKASLIANLNVDNVVDSLLLAEHYNLKDLMVLARGFFRSNIDKIEKAQECLEKLKNDPDFIVKLVRLCKD